MNKIFLVVLMFTTSAFANLEHEKGQGAPPSEKRLSIARECFAEVENAGCGHPRNGQDAFNNCLEVKMDILNPTCQSFFQRLYGKRK